MVLLKLSGITQSQNKYLLLIRCVRMLSYQLLGSHKQYAKPSDIYKGTSILFGFDILLTEMLAPHTSNNKVG